jgi:acetyltransferase-like isoleucine patch superfamily enzyme
VRSLPHDWYEAGIPENVTIGERSWLYSAYAFLHYRSERPTGVRIGRDSGVYIGTLFDVGPDGEVEIGDFCTIAGPVISTNGRVEIGGYAFISFQVTIADGPHAVPPTSRAAHDGGRPEIVIEENVWIGAKAVILPGAHLGEGSVVGAATVVDFEVPPYSIAAGSPARVVPGRGRRRVAS